MRTLPTALHPRRYIHSLSSLRLLRQQVSWNNALLPSLYPSNQVARQNKVIHVLQGKIGQYRALLKTHGIPDTVAPDDSFLAADMAALVASESAVEERDTDPDSGDVGEEGAIVPVTKAMGSLAVSGAGAGSAGRDPKYVPHTLCLQCAVQYHARA